MLNTKFFKPLDINICMPFQKGHMPFSGTEETRFKRGSTPWNKGISPSEETRRKISISRKRLVDKNCPSCNKIFSPYFKNQKTCCKECSKEHMGIIMKGKNKGVRNSPNTEFKKGQISPNKGKKLDYISNEKHPFWKGDNAGYVAMHSWIKRKFGKANICENCGEINKKIEWSNKNHKYSRHREDWQKLCTKCHRRHDRGLL